MSVSQAAINALETQTIVTIARVDSTRQMRGIASTAGNTTVNVINAMKRTVTIARVAIGRSKTSA